MRCEDAAELVSALCDGEKIPREAAQHVGECQGCQARLNAYSIMGAELRRIASLQEEAELEPGSWKQVPRVRLNWWQKGRTTIRIPRFAFALMLGLILLLSSGLVLVRARAGAGGGPVLVVTLKKPNGRVAHFSFLTSANSRTTPYNWSTADQSESGLFLASVRFVTKEGDKAELGIKARCEHQPRISNPDTTQELKDVPEDMVWIEPGSKQEIAVPGLGELELTGEYLDHIPALPFQPGETLDAKNNEFRIVSPVLIRGKQLVFNLAGSNSIYDGDEPPALIMYFPGEGRYLVSTVPFEGAVEGIVEPGQIKFSLDGDEYILLTAMPTTRSEHIWVTHDPEYRLSQHMQGASDDEPMFMVRKLSDLLKDQIHH